ISLGSEYWLNSQFAWLVGFNYADTGAPDKSFAATEYALDSSMVGTGVKYKPNETTEWTVALNHYFYDSRSVENIKYEKEISSIGVNFVKKF
ncbi:MAG: OmpP1/FadL family transporter, partial [Cetobacterium sp.]